MEVAYIWVIFGKLPTTLILSAALYICAKRIGPLIAAWSFSAFFVTLSVGATLFPSIIGALAGGTISLLLVLSFLSNQAKLWRSVIWPLVSAFVSLIMIGRIGCWLSGCCFGELSHLPWATQYTDELTIGIYHAQRYGALAEHGPLTVHPVQVYESLGAFALLIGFTLNKKRLGEVSSAFLLLGSYLSLYAILNPLRAYLNTPSSLVMWWGVSKLQWTLLTLSVGAVIIALRYIKTSRLTLMNMQNPNQHNQFFGRSSVFKLIILWAFMVGVGSLSLYLGTPFSAQLSMVGMCLSTVALLDSLALHNHRFNIRLSIPQRLLPSSSDLGLTVSFRSILLLALLPLCLIPLTLRSNAAPDGSDYLSSGKNWVYHMDQKSKKLLRIGRVEDILVPFSSVDVDHDFQRSQEKDSMYDDLKGSRLSTQDPVRVKKNKVKPQKPRVSFTLGRSKLNVVDNEYQITEGDDSCSGPDSITTYKNQQTRSYNVAVIGYDLPMFESGAKHRLLGSWYHEKINGNRQIDYDDFDDNSDNTIEDNKVFLDQMHLGFAYEFTNRFLRLGAGLRFTWGNTNDQFTKSDSEYSVNKVAPDILFGFGYKYVFYESGIGPVWGAPGLANPFVGLGVYAPFSERLQFFGRLGNAFLGPGDIHIIVGEVGVQTHYVRASFSFSESQLFGAKLGVVF
ncbi:MAG: hypothetical protein CMH49_09565 [Myxococcales bacterium]|nr:hypothetical protein [Myxococcales bacterium]